MFSLLYIKELRRGCVANTAELHATNSITYSDIKYRNSLLSGTVSRHFRVQPTALGGYGGHYIVTIINVAYIIEEKARKEEKTPLWTYVGELAFNMLVLVGSVKISGRIFREMMGL